MSTIKEFGDPEFGPEMHEAKAAMLKAGFAGLVGSIPHLGPMLQAVTFTYHSELQFLRVSKFFTHLSEAIKAVDTSKIDKEYLVSEGFHDLIIEVVEEVKKCRHHEKLLRFKEVVLAQIQEPLDSDHAISFIALIASIEEVELTLLLTYQKYSEGLQKLYTNSYELENQLKAADERHDQKYSKTFDDSQAFWQSTRSSGSIGAKLQSVNDEIYEKNQLLIPARLGISDQQIEYYSNILVGKGLLVIKPVLKGSNLLKFEQIYLITGYGKEFIRFLQKA
jgi:hypothetical protein